MPIQVAVYKGYQDLGFGDGRGFQLWDFLVPVYDPAFEGEEDAYRPVGSTTTEETLKKLVPGIIIPEHPKPGDIAFTDEALPERPQEKPQVALSFESVFLKYLRK